MIRSRRDPIDHRPIVNGRQEWRISTPRLNRHLIDLGGHDEIVLGETDDGVGPQNDTHLSIPFKMKIGVMPLVFGERGDFC